jgi:hypothetical protein
MTYQEPAEEGGQLPDDEQPVEKREEPSPVDDLAETSPRTRRSKSNFLCADPQNTAARK